ncbi:MAG: hypothetical protein R3A79_26375, partial [Nannocystaceae bacterium]
ASQAAVKEAVDRGFGVVGDAWSSGQLVSTIRTPALYYVTSLLTQEGTLAVLCGTTNRDEGSYLGFFGKASDGMVDLQPISDLHKSEVYALAERLGVPAEVREATPTGDTYDGRVDEAMIGAPYDFVELYTALLAAEAAHPGARRSLTATWSEGARGAFDRWAAAVEALHRHNHHKYVAGAAAIHVDVYERHVPGGWSAPPRVTPAKGDFVAEFELDPAIPAALEARRPRFAGEAGTRGAAVPGFGESLVIVDGLLDADEAATLRAHVKAQAQVAVGVHGIADGYDPSTDAPGSTRATTYSHALADALWRRLAPALPPVRIFADDAPTDHGGHPVWRPVGLSPLFRAMTYGRGGALVPHYDAGFDFGDGERRTLMSVLIGLSLGERERDSDVDDGRSTTAPTRFIVDRQRHRPLAERDFRDHEGPAADADVLAAFALTPGRALVFDHRLLHEAAAWPFDQERVLLRADVVFTRCGPPLPAPPPAPPLALEEALGLGDERSPAAVDAAYARLRAATSEERPALRFAWRLLRDPHYASAYRAIGDAAASVEVGFFDDGAALEDAATERAASDPAWMVTPLDKALRRLAALPRPPRRPAVLVTTGAFCPIHRGHLEMMELARAALEARGAAVLGGYISVSHDAYVLKKCGAEAPVAGERLAMCEAAVAASDWLMVDPWEALSCPRAVNFTDVVRRLEGYLNAHLRTAPPIEVVYVFGSDNAEFALAFAARGRCVCVPRPGEAAALERMREHPALKGNPRVILGERPAPALASARVRAGDDAGLSPPVRALWRRAQVDDAGPPLRLFIRDERAWAIAPWLAGRDRAALTEARRRHLDGLRGALLEAFAAAGRALEIEALDLDTQAESLRALRAEGPVLSLDPCLPGDLDLEVSRCFELAVDVSRPGLVARPGAPPIAAQLAALPRASPPVILFDDDRVTGRTLAEVERLVGERLTIRRAVALCAAPADASRRELCDARDLLPGARAGGLVVALPDGALARAPYLLPYVRPSARIQLPRAAEVRFSATLWSLAAAFFAAVGPPIRVADADPAFRRLAAYVGFAPETAMEALCRWHVDRLGGRPTARR